MAKGPFSWSTVARSRVRRWTHKVFDYFEGVRDGYRKSNTAATC
jgi:hypothetical protein